MKDFDPKTRWFHLDENKTDDPRTWVMREDTAEALRLYLKHIHPDPQPNASLLVQGDYIRTAGQRLNSRARATALRKNAELAGLIRPQLWENTTSRRHLTIHDLRATFVTISLAEGKSEAWITDRTGHTSNAMLYRYKRPARAYAEANLGPLHPLHEVIPELRALAEAAKIARSSAATSAPLPDADRIPTSNTAPTRLPQASPRDGAGTHAVPTPMFEIPDEDPALIS